MRNYEVYLTVFQMPDNYKGPRFFPVYTFSNKDTLYNMATLFNGCGAIPIFRGLLITDDMNIARDFPSKVSPVVEKSNVAEDLNKVVRKKSSRLLDKSF